MKRRHSVRREAPSLSAILEEVHLIETFETTIERVLISREGPYDYLALVEFSLNEVEERVPNKPRLPGFD